jgi:precorrin-2 dehydrogenase / sirohydrochlorin ferrochelatase
MFPLILTGGHTRILLIGEGPLADKRARQMLEAGMTLTRLPAAEVTDEHLAAAHAVYIVDVAPQDAQTLAARARALHTLVNVEDVPELCDFHTPAIVRRGDLLFSVSTNGKSPALARRLRRYLEGRFPSFWAERLDKLGNMRQTWRSHGLKMDEVAAKTEAVIDEEGWLDE